MALEWRAADSLGRSDSEWLAQRSEAERDAADLIAGGEIDTIVVMRVVSPAVCNWRRTSNARRTARLMVSAPERPETVRRRRLTVIEGAGR